MKELNRKLAEWAGFSIRSVWDTGFQLFKTPQKPSPDGVHYDEEEFEENWYKAISTDYFTSSLDACFKWLVPKLYSWRIGTHFTPDPNDFSQLIPSDCYAEASSIVYAGYTEADTPALALCLALEKLIDAKGE